MELDFTRIFSVVWLGILTSISPCPLATNIAATTYIGRRIVSPFGTVLAAAAYTLGRTLAYVIIASAILAGLFSIPGVALFLQSHMNKILGPVLLAAGLFVLELIPLKMPSVGLNLNLLKRLGDSGMPGAVAMGFLFALAFCPVSAALFFGGVIPLSLETRSRFFLPLLYGIGTAAPVIGSAMIIAYSTRLAGLFFNRLSVFEGWFRRVTGIVFVLIGLYFCLKYIFRIIDF
jgi:hypothetical protein